MQARARLPVLLAVAGLMALASLETEAQIWPPDVPVADTEETLDFDRPESWAMARLSTVTQMSAMGTDPHKPSTGRLGMDLGFEAFWIPQLSEEQQRVGFNGQYEQNLDWSPVAGRIRATLRGRAGWFAEVGLSPPLLIGTLQPIFLDGSFGLRMDAVEGGRVQLRTHGRWGQLRGDILCPEEVVQDRDTADNPLNCHGPSRDQIITNTIGLEVGGDYAVGRWHPHLATSLQYLRTEYNHGARYHGDDDNDDVDRTMDRRRLATDGVTWALMGGVTFVPGWLDLPVTVEGSYTPLMVDRHEAGEERDGVFHLRILVRSRVM